MNSSEKTVLTVLVAESDTINRLIICALFQRKGWKAIEAKNGMHAVEQFRNNKIDVVLMNIHLPEMDGFEAQRILKSEMARTGKRVPIIAVAGNTSEATRKRCLEVGMDNLITRPIRTETLFEIVNETEKNFNSITIEI